jgi:uncharacterized membrane protein HdeD (DUF308 family)
MTDSPGASPLPRSMSAFGDHWGLVVGFGVISIGLGLVLVFWPKHTLVVLAVLIGIQLIVGGVYRLISALTVRSVDGGIRGLIAISGALSLIVGLLCLREPVQTVTFVGLLIGAFWAVSGIIDTLSAVFGGPGRRGWRIVSGLVSTVAGLFLLAYPELSLTFLVIVIAVWLFAYGGIAVIVGLTLRSSPGRDVAGDAAPA